MTHEWRAQLVGYDGTSLGYLPTKERQLTVRLKDWSTFEAIVDLPTERADLLPLIPARMINVWRDSTQVFGGIISDDSSITVTPPRLHLVAHDAFWHYSHMQARTRLEYLAVTDRSHIIFGVLRSWEPAWPEYGSPLRLDYDDCFTSTSAATFEMERGANLADTVKEVADAQGGPFFVIEPYNGPQALWVPAPQRRWCVSKIVARPLSGVDRPAALFEHGAGTYGNVTDVTLDLKLPTNYVTAEANGQQIPAGDVTSVATYGPWMETVSPQSAKDIVELQVAASGKVKAVPTAAVTFTPTPESPMLWDDFNVGDMVRVTVRQGAIEWVAKPARVMSATVDGLDDRLLELVVELEVPLV